MEALYIHSSYIPSFILSSSTTFTISIWMAIQVKLWQALKITVQLTESLFSVMCQQFSMSVYTRIRTAVAGTVQTRYRVARLGQLKEQGGFSVSKSVTLPSAPLRPGGVIIMMIFPPTYKKAVWSTRIHKSLFLELITGSISRKIKLLFCNRPVTCARDCILCDCAHVYLWLKTF